MTSDGSAGRRNWVNVPAWDAEGTDPAQPEPSAAATPAPPGPRASGPAPARAPPRPPGPLATLLTRWRPGGDEVVYTRAARMLSLALITLLLLSGLVWAGTDLDGDGVPSYREWSHGTRSGARDTDGDGLPDGWELRRGLDPTRRDQDRDGLSDRYERARGMDPFSADADGDGLDDAEEVALGSDPANEDTDGDGILDRDEAPDDPTDCDRDGLRAIVDPDDDDDGRPDGDEPRRERCEPDVDGDRVLDGDEGAEVCIRRVDCDDDGLPDGDEAVRGFDPLDPDTFDVRILDATVRLFAEAGQGASGDEDDDSIPDEWESASGLIDWGAFDPEPGTRDLLVEFVRVVGPDSARFDHLDFRSAYANVANAFLLGSGIRMQYVETTVRLPDERIAPFLPSSDSAYYADVLGRAAHSANPYVTTVVMNPQHDQSGVLHYGAAPIRGMLAAVDYGSHTTFTYANGDQEIEFTPLWESVAHADRQDIITASGFQSGGINDNGDVFLVTTTYTLKWRAFWFASPPQVVPHNGSPQFALAYRGAEVDLVGLQRTILHELGHTLGLCHTELVECRSEFSAADQRRYRESAMFTGAAPDILRFLPSEWAQVDLFLTCPPQPPLVALAEGAEPSVIITEKYGYQLEEILDVGVRGCGDFDPVVRDLERATFGPAYAPQEPDPGVPLARSSPWPLVSFWAVTLALGAALVWFLAQRLLPPRQTASMK